MLSKTMQDAMNDQLNFELYSSYIYLSMSAYFNDQNLTGFANWMKIQAQEELVHSMLFFKHINERGGRVLLEPVEGPATTWATPLKAFEVALEHEHLVTSRIHKLVDLALKESDHATHNFLQWFVSEQVEEEAAADAIAKQLRLSEGQAQALFMIDRELGARVFTMPAGVTI